jgi:hypothetical protein
MLSFHFIKVEDEASPFIYVHVFMLSLMLIPSFNFMFIHFNSVLVTKIELIVVYKSLNVNTRCNRRYIG